MKTLFIMTKRNSKLFFKDKGMFFTALITPAILLVLYGTFLGKIYKDSFTMQFPQGFTIDEKIIDGFVAAQLMSSILAVSCVTVAFCSNMLCVQDKANGSIRDLTIAPVKPHVLSMSYYLATFLTTLIVCISAAALCLIYVGIVGFYMTFGDIMLVLLDVILVSMFGTVLSSIVSYFLNTQGQMSAVGSIVSSVYGFICGAYMPISQFADGLQKVLSFLPGTYGTALLRKHSMRGVFKELVDAGIPSEIVDGIEKNVDSRIYFFDHEVSELSMFMIIIGSIVVLLGIYILINYFMSKKKYKTR